MSRALRTRRHARIWANASSWVLPARPMLPALPLPVRFWLGMVARPVAVVALGGVAALLSSPEAAHVVAALRLALSLIGGLK